MVGTIEDGASRRPRFKPEVRFWAFMTLFALLMLNGLWGGLCFDSPRLNDLTLGLAFLMPWLGFRLLAPCRESRGKFWTAVLLWPVAAVSTCSFFVWGIDMLLRSDPRMQDELVRVVPVDGTEIRAYRISAGGTASTTVVLRRERRLALGLKWVQGIHAANEAYDVTIQPLGGGRVRCIYSYLTYSPLGEEPPETRSVVLRLPPWL